MREMSTSPQRTLPPTAPCAVVHDAARDVWLLFEAPRRVVAATACAEVLPALHAVEHAVRDGGLHAVGFVAYEAAPAFDAALKVRPDRGFPLLWFGLFDAPAELDLPQAPSGAFAVPGDWKPTVDPAAYAEAIAAVKDAIREGETYQVNYTYRLHASAPTTPWTAFLQLAEAQRAQYGAYIDTGDWVLCSASPELFFRREGRRVSSSPMKGTARRRAGPEEDQAQRTALLASEKDRAEHLMIVDMVRNDLGRIADTGSVTIHALLAAERYPTVWQLTSTVCAATDAPLRELFGALFPPASITGAPKARTMELIAALETTPRRVYTGTIGFVRPDGDAQFNVAIRTLLCDRRTGEAEYGVGGGIVWDSDAADERREAELKARILSTRHPDFDLLETLLWTPSAGFALLELHLRRLVRSADYFGYACDPHDVEFELRRAVSGCPLVRHRVRLVVARHGGAQATAVALDPTRPPGFADPTLDVEPIDAEDPFLRHKTTHRAVYAAALARNPGAADVLLRNERGEITEGTLANLVYRLDGQFWTPPVSGGLLPGTYRAWLLAVGRVRERPLRVEDVGQVEVFFFANSVRGLHRIRILDSPHSRSP